MVTFDVQSDAFLYRRVIHTEGFPQPPDRAFVGDGAVEAEAVRAALGSRQPAAFLVPLAATRGTESFPFSCQTVIPGIFNRDFPYKFVASRLPVHL